MEGSQMIFFVLVGVVGILFGILGMVAYNHFSRKPYNEMLRRDLQQSLETLLAKSRNEAAQVERQTVAVKHQIEQALQDLEQEKVVTMNAADSTRQKEWSSIDEDLQLVEKRKTLLEKEQDNARLKAATFDLLRSHRIDPTKFKPPKDWWQRNRWFVLMLAFFVGIFLLIILKP